MKKYFKQFMLCFLLLVMTISTIGCGKSVSKKELDEVNNKIVEYFSSDNVKYDNLSFNYVDLTNNVVVVGLLENTKEQQKKFRDMVVDSKYLSFVEGENLNYNDAYAY